MRERPANWRDRLREIRRCAAPGCVKVLTRRDNEGAISFLERRYCSRKCSTTRYGSLSEGQARCCAREECGRELKKRPNEGRSSFAVRKFCCRECSVIFSRKYRDPVYDGRFSLNPRGEWPATARFEDDPRASLPDLAPRLPMRPATLVGAREANS